MLLVMGKKKQNSDRHLHPQIGLRLPARICQALDSYVESIDSRRTTEIIIAIREYLESKGYWPPPDGK